MGRRPFSAALAAAAIVVAALAGGCGANASQDAVRTTAADFMAAARDPSASVCDIVSSRFLHERTGKSGPAALAACRSTARLDTGKINRAIPPQIDVTSVTVDGDTAYARLDARGERTGFLRLVREDGRWKVDAADPS